MSQSVDFVSSGFMSRIGNSAMLQSFKKHKIIIYVVHIVKYSYKIQCQIHHRRQETN
jgi:hypothetical protein